MPMTTEQRATLEEVTQFIYREARLQDGHRPPLRRPTTSVIGGLSSRAGAKR